MNRVRACLVALLAAWIVALLSGCGLPELAGGSSSTETGEKVALTGRVMNGDHPVPGVAVELARAGLSDTTDATGAYRLVGTPATTPASSSLPDTLRFEVNGRTITRQSVSAWVSGLPDLQVVQRGFSGGLTQDGPTVGRVIAVLTGDGIAPGDSMTAEFYYNALAANYSGFLYFPAAGQTMNYAIRADAYDVDGRLVGSSLTVPFNSNAGNIVIPTFNTANIVTP